MTSNVGREVAHRDAPALAIAFLGVANSIHVRTADQVLRSPEVGQHAREDRGNGIAACGRKCSATNDST